MATSGLAGGVQMATRDPSASRASRIGRVAGSSPSGRAMWIAARWSHAAVSSGASWGSSFPAAFDPDVVGAVDHEFGDLRILEHGLKSGQERLQVSDPARPLHSRPSSRSRQ